MNEWGISPHPLALTAPITGGFDWAGKALCAHVDPDLFFPDEYSHAADARAICRGCEARTACLEYVLEHPQIGVWGGFTERTRKISAREWAGKSAEDIIADDDARHYAQAEKSAGLAAARAARKRDSERAKSAATRAATRTAIEELEDLEDAS